MLRWRLEFESTAWIVDIGKGYAIPSLVHSSADDRIAFTFFARRKLEFDQIRSATVFNALN